MLDLEAVGLRNIPLCGRYDYARAHPPLARHSHGNVFEICLLARGEQSYMVQGNEFLLGGGDLFVTKPYEVHGSRNSPQQRGVLYWLQLCCPKKGCRLLGLSATATHDLVEELRGLDRHVYHGGMKLVPLWDRILAGHAEAGTPLGLANLSNLLLRLLLDVIDLTREQDQSPVSAPIRDSIRYMEEHISDSILIENMALRVGLSPSHYSTRFKREVGVPPGEYVARRRVDMAKERLEKHVASITDIAHELGFCSSQYFANVFNRYTGLTPRQYRKGIRHSELFDSPVTGAGIRFHPVKTT